MSERIHAPWTLAQVESLNAYQASGAAHPFTGERHEDGTECILVATEAGWMVCDGDGPVVQTWCWSWMCDGSWRQMGIDT
jgi:hypothetical protein